MRCFVSLDLMLGRYNRFNETKSNNIVYESPYSHFQVSNINLLISNVKKDTEFYKYFIAALKEFDSNIEDVDLFANNDSGLEITDISIKSNGV